MTKSLGPLPRLLVLVGVQNTDMDLRSRENSRVTSFFHCLSMSDLTALATSALEPRLAMPWGLIFSARTSRAASVGSPTFS